MWESLQNTNSLQRLDVVSPQLAGWQLQPATGVGNRVVTCSHRGRRLDQAGLGRVAQRVTHPLGSLMLCERRQR